MQCKYAGTCDSTHPQVYLRYQVGNTRYRYSGIGRVQVLRLLENMKIHLVVYRYISGTDEVQKLILVCRDEDAGNFPGRCEVKVLKI